MAYTVQHLLDWVHHASLLAAAEACGNPTLPLITRGRVSRGGKYVPPRLVGAAALPGPEEARWMRVRALIEELQRELLDEATDLGVPLR